MNPKRKQKSHARDARKQKLQQRRQSAPKLSVTTMNIQREIDYIVRRAVEHDARCVAMGALTFFSTQTGDAWMLDTDDGLALCLARDGESQPVLIIETETKTAVEWDRTFSIEGDHFTTIETKTGRITTVLGYPTRAVLATIQSAKYLDP